MDIKIDIADDRYFIDVAPVVDRDDFAKEVERIRSVLGVTIPLPDNYFPKHPYQKQEKLIDKEIEQSRRTLCLPIVFRSVISAVVFYNRVSDHDYSPVLLVKESNTFLNRVSTPDETYSIVLSPGARDQDVLKAYQEYRDMLGNVKGVPYYEFTNLVWNINKKKPSIKKYRKWYKAMKAGDSIADITNKEAEDGTAYEESTIRKGIDTYKTLLRKTPTF